MHFTKKRLAIGCIIFLAVVSVTISGLFFYKASALPPVKLDNTTVTGKTLVYNGGKDNGKNNDIQTSPSSMDQPVASSSSKLGIFILSSYSDGAKSIIQQKPRVIKVMDPQISQSLLQAVRDYKEKLPNGTVILRFSGEKKKYSLQDDPTKAADEYFDRSIAPGLTALGGGIGLFDYIEAPNEVEVSQNWETIEEASWNGLFWKRIIQRSAQKKLSTCAGSIPVGNPGGSTDEITTKMKAFSPALTALRAHGGALCYHAYSTEYTRDVGTENWFSLRHRIIHTALLSVDPDYANIPFILSEAGIDQTGDPATSGWQARGSEEDYQVWLTWYDKELQKDNYVIGTTLFQIGDGYWSSFDLEPIVWWLQRHLEQGDVQIKQPQM